jgi:hypothetical protein
MLISYLDRAAALFKRLQSESCYIHIPKTGGTYLAQLETDGESVVHPMKYFGHCLVVNNEADSSEYGRMIGYLDKPAIKLHELKKLFVVSTVRNPYSWLVSYAGHAGGWNQKYKHSSHYDYENAQKGFDYLVRTIADRDSDIWPNRKFIHFAIFSNSGDLAADWLNRTESLDEDLMVLAKARGLTFNQRERQRVGGLQDYRSYYNNALIELVRSTWGREMSLYGYDFDGVASSTPILGREISRKTKQCVYYNWFSDTLTVNGNVVAR